MTNLRGMPRSKKPNHYCIPCSLDFNLLNTPKTPSFHPLFREPLNLHLSVFFSLFGHETSCLVTLLELGPMDSDLDSTWGLPLGSIEKNLETLQFRQTQPSESPQTAENGRRIKNYTRIINRHDGRLELTALEVFNHNPKSLGFWNPKKITKAK